VWEPWESSGAALILIFNDCHNPGCVYATAAGKGLRSGRRSDSSTTLAAAESSPTTEPHPKAAAARWRHRVLAPALAMRWLLLLLLSHCRFGLALRTLPAAPARLLGRAGRRGTATAAAQLRMSGADAHEYADGLPIAALLPEVVSSLRAEPNLVLEAPPGAGKTTTVPLALLRDDGADSWSGGGGGLIMVPLH
jgi:hypothetical protein